jgi:hypothetical protein
LFSSHPDLSKCPSKKEHKKHEAESDEFQRNSSGPASFFLCHPSTHPSSKTTQALLLNPEKEQENKKTAWFIRLNIPLRRSRLSGKMETTCPDRRKPL